MQFLKISIFNSMLYACEIRVLTKDSERKVLAFQKKCYRKIMWKGWSRKVTNKELYTKVQPKRNLIQEVIRRKLQLFGHRCRMSISWKVKLLGFFSILYGNNKVRRPRREWVDDIINWCRASLQVLRYSAQDRTKWNQIIKEASAFNRG